MTDKELIKQEIERRLKETNTLIDDTAGTNRGLWLVSNELDEILQFIDSLPEEPASENKSEKELSETYLATFDKKYPILPTLKGKQKADFKNFLNKCQQEFGLKEFGIHPTQSKLFEKLTLLWAAWGAEYLVDLGESNKYEFDKEPISEDLEEEINNYFKDWTFDDEMSVMVKPNHYFAEFNDIKEIASHFAEWQKQQDYKMYTHVPLKDIHDAWQELKKNKPDIENYPAVCFQKGSDWRENQMKEALQTEYEKGRFDMQQEMMKDAVEGTVKYEIGSAEIPQCDRRYQVLSDPTPIANAKLGDKVKIIIIKPEQQ